MKKVRLREKGRVSSSVLVFEWKGRLVDLSTAMRTADPAHSTVQARVRQGFTIAAALSPVMGACRFCGERHPPRDCYAPVQRGWGWPGWELEDNQAKAQSLRSRQWRPRRKKRTLSAARAWILSNRTACMAKSKSVSPKAIRTSGGTPRKPA